MTSNAPDLGLQGRVNYLDWLRAMAVLGVVVYHALQPFGAINWFITNDERSPALTMVVALLSSFGMPILFLVAGASARFTLQRRSTREFIAERATRLLIPFAVGTIVLSPISGYIFAVSSGTATDSFLAYVASYPGIVLDYNITNVGLSMRLLLVGMHLWFLGALFIFSVVGAPLFALLSSPRGRRVLESLSHLARVPGATLLFAIPATLPILILFASTTQPELWDSWSFGWFAVVFLLGYVIYSDPRLIRAARRDMPVAAVTAAVGSIGLAATDFVHWSAIAQPYGIAYALMLTLYGTTGWAWTMTLLGIGMRLRAAQRPLPTRVANISLPLYVVHMPIVLAISAVVVRSSLDLWPKLVVNVALALGLSLIGATIASSVPGLRRLFGKPRAPQPETPSQAALASPGT
jgi:glucans biosynthesis protein C